MLLSLTLASLALWVSLWLLPWRPWSTRERIESCPTPPHPDLGSVTVLIPARDEAATLARTLRAVAAQAPVSIVLIDDQSSDGTAEVARKLAIPTLRVIDGQAPPPEWSGKLWALHQGLQHIDTPYTLLIDADIELEPGLLNALLEKLLTERRALVSVMARLSMESFWERLLIPPFIYFFKLVYPFALANSPSRRVAAAAGGCILIKTAVLREIGGFAALRGALIDDCTLARKVKDHGGSTWLGLSHGVRAIRPYADLAEIWNMVARTAFTQLHYSTTLLLACTALMVLTFLVPGLALFAGSPVIRGLAALASVMMLTTYLPTLSYYRRSLWWILTLPVAATMYLAMTWTSALRYWRGERSRWKNRVYERT